MFPVRRKVRDLAEAEVLLSSLSESELSLTTFCRQRGIDARSLHCWRLNLTQREAPPTSAPLRLVELTLPQTDPSARYQIHIGDTTIECDDHCNEHTLARLLRVIHSC
jgi:hypothetical protein